MLQKTGERQVGTELQEIRLDHRLRYEWVSNNIPSVKSILDVGCGVGYGSKILSVGSTKVYGIDVDAAVIEFARKYWASDSVTFAVMDACSLSFAEDVKFDVATVFEVVEHLAAPNLFLTALHRVLADDALLFVSVPNEEVVAHTIELNPFHIQHYTPTNLSNLLNDAGFEIEEVFSQDESEVAPGNQGRTLIVRCRRNLGGAAKSEPTDWPAALTNAAREIVERGKVIRKLQKAIRKAALRLDQPDETLESSKRRDAGYQTEIRSMFDELGILGQQLRVVKAENESLESMRIEAEYALTRASNVLAIQNNELRKRKEQQQLQAAKEVELNALLSSRASELEEQRQENLWRKKKMKAKLAEIEVLTASEQSLTEALSIQVAALEAQRQQFESMEVLLKASLAESERNIAKQQQQSRKLSEELAASLHRVKTLRDEKSQQIRFFNPKNPKIGSLARLTWRHRFFIPIIVMAPLNSVYGVYKKYLGKSANILR